jgi:hypothetical protein
MEPAIPGKTRSSLIEPTPDAPGAPKSILFIAGFVISGRAAQAA